MRSASACGSTWMSLAPLARRRRRRSSLTSRTIGRVADVGPLGRRGAVVLDVPRPRDIAARSVGASRSSDSDQARADVVADLAVGGDGHDRSPPRRCRALTSSRATTLVGSPIATREPPRGVRETSRMTWRSARARGSSRGIVGVDGLLAEVDELEVEGLGERVRDVALGRPGRARRPAGPAAAAASPGGTSACAARVSASCGSVSTPWLTSTSPSRRRAEPAFDSGVRRASAVARGIRAPSP